MQIITCSKCGLEKPITDYRNQFDNKRGEHYRNHTCRACIRKMAKVLYYKNIERRREQTRQSYKKMYALDPLKQKVYRAEQKMRYKREVMARYGNGKAQCFVCGFDNIDALCLDHINDDGKKDRKPGQGGGFQFYSKLRTRGFPSGYQTLCSNHNLIKQIERYRRDRGY